MKTKFQELLENNADMFECEVRSYSGRGMYGKECLAVTGSSSELRDLFKEVILDAANLEVILDAANLFVDDGFDLYEFQDIVDSCFEYSQDSMGCDVVYYWRNISFVE